MKRKFQVDPKIKAAFEAKIAECINIARQKSGKNIPIFPLEFRQMGQRAGVCQISLIYDTKLFINPDFLKKHYDDQLNDTVPHEVAHGVVHALWPDNRMFSRRRRTVHGDHWQTVMGWFGIPNPSTRHSYDMDGVATRKKVVRPFNYVCGCGYPHKLTLRLHEKIQMDGKHRMCKLCRKKIVYERQVGKPPRPSVTLKATEIVPVRVRPMAPATHRVITRLINGVLQNIRIPLTTKEIAI